MVAVWVRRSMRATWPVTKSLHPVKSPSPALARRACSPSSTPARLALRSAPTRTVASMEASIAWPIASVMETCRVSRSIAKSNVSPAMSPEGSNQAASVNCPASHVYEPGSNRCWDLGGKRQSDGTLAPSEEVGEPAVRDDDVRERVRGQRDIRQRPLVRKPGKAQLKHADSLPAVGHRREQTDTISVGFHLKRLAGQRAAMRASHQVDALRRFTPLGPAGRRAVGIAESHERRPLKSATRKETSEVPSASVRRSARTSAAATGDAFSTAASSPGKSTRASGSLGTR